MRSLRHLLVGREESRSLRLKERMSEVLPEVSLLFVPFIRTRSLPFSLNLTGDKHAFVFTSPGSVEHFDFKMLPSSSILCALGVATARHLSEKGHKVDFVSEKENAREMAPELSDFLHTSGNNALHIIQPCSDISGDYLREYMRKSGFRYDKVTTYCTEPSPELKAREVEIDDFAPECILFYSPSGVRAWMQEREPLPAISIGPSTTETLMELGFREITESPSPHPEDIADTIHRYSQSLTT